MARKANQQDTIERSVTAFGLTVAPAGLLSEPAVLLVNNVADPSASGGMFGKRAGFGMGGGGMKAEEYEDPTSAVKREYRAETGLTVLHAYELGAHEEWKLIKTPLDPRTGLPSGKPVVEFFKRGQRPGLTDENREQVKRRRLQVIENPVYLFKMSVQWEKSALAQILTQTKDRLTTAGATQEDLERGSMGIWLGYLDPENIKIKSLLNRGEITIQRIDELNRSRGLPGLSTLRNMSVRDIDELCREKDLLTSEETAALDIEELHEIDGLFLFTYPFLMEQLDDIEKGIAGSSSFYFGHLRRIREVVQAGGLPDLAKYIKSKSKTGE